jgi:hypothetical protein
MGNPGDKAISMMVAAAHDAILAQQKGEAPIDPVPAKRRKNVYCGWCGIRIKGSSGKIIEAPPNGGYTCNDWNCWKGLEKHFVVNAFRWPETHLPKIMEAQNKKFITFYILTTISAAIIGLLLRFV